MSKLVVTKEHIQLLQNMYISWGHDEWGAPCVDPKRPYGNSGVYEDIAPILGIPELDEEEGYEEYSDEDYAKMDKIHEEMQIVLQIMVTNVGISEGSYEQDDFYNWLRSEPVNPVAEAFQVI